MENKDKKIKAAELNDEELDKVTGATSEVASETNDADEQEVVLLKPIQIER